MSSQHLQSSTQSMFIQRQNPKNNHSEYRSCMSPCLKGLLVGALTAGLLLSVFITLWLTERKVGSTTKTIITTKTTVTTSTTTTETTTITYARTGIYALTIPPCATWDQQGITVAGDRNGNSGSGLGELNGPVTIFVNNNDTLVITDRDNHRIMRYYPNATSGQIIAGGNAAGNSANQLNQPKGVALDQSGDLIVADSNNYRIQKFVNGSLIGITLFSNSTLNLLGEMRDLNIDVNNNIYVTDSDFNKIIKYSPYLSTGTILAGGSTGSANNQLLNPYGCYTDAQNTLYIADSGNNRVMKYVSGSNTGVLVAGDSIAGGSGQNQLQNPKAVIVDNNGYIYVADSGNDRIMRWTTNYTAGGNCIVGCTGSSGSAANQLDTPRDLKFDQYGNLYVTDQNNDRIQKFLIQRPATCPTSGR